MYDSLFHTNILRLENFFPTFLWSIFRVSFLLSCPVYRGSFAVCFLHCCIPRYTLLKQVTVKNFIRAGELSQWWAYLLYRHGHPQSEGHNTSLETKGANRRISYEPHSLFSERPHDRIGHPLCFSSLCMCTWVCTLTRTQHKNTHAHMHTQRFIISTLLFISVTVLLYE